MRLTLLCLTAIAGTALADFLIGNCASSGIEKGTSTRNEIALPGAEVDCNYKSVPKDKDICDASLTEIRTHNNGGVCPGNDDNRSLSFCGIPLQGTGCPDSYQMNTRDDCGDAALKFNKLPEDGFFYADLIDTAKNNIAVGRCVYEAAAGAKKVETCPASGKDEEEKCATFIRCYTGMYGSQNC
ncbi:Hypothetical predicted protein [Lecanosticta acicola]|uniref:Uncharacterized protein n=1 Tax=Lecanosticta acicola TaxID=111012 RepID=A0AAI8Z658_9PEZI|nr:Hypothetical predicted protein [Lecanosticta acicola]